MGVWLFERCVYLPRQIAKVFINKARVWHCWWCNSGTQFPIQAHSPFSLTKLINFAGRKLVSFFAIGVEKSIKLSFSACIIHIRVKIADESRCAQSFITQNPFHVAASLWLASEMRTRVSVCCFRFRFVRLVASHNRILSLWTKTFNKDFAP